MVVSSASDLQTRGTIGSMRNAQAGSGRRRRGKPREEEGDGLEERVVRIDRTRKTVKGGRVSSVRVCAAVGDGKGNVGLGVGKAREIPPAIEKAIARARENMIRIPLDGYTIPHQIEGKVGGAVILLRPASRGTGVIAGGATRQILEVSGIRDILTKSLGSGNVFNRAQATFKALKQIYDPADIAAERGITVEAMTGRSIEDAYAKAEQEAAEAAEAEAAAKAEAQAQAAEAKALAAEAEAIATQQAAEAAEEEQSEEVAVEADTQPDEEASSEAAVQDNMTDSLTELFVSDTTQDAEEKDE
jgi:small subunit ribosomal protein S5